MYEVKTIGGRLATIEIDNNEFEAGGSIIESENRYMQDFVKLLGTLFYSFSYLYCYDGINIQDGLIVVKL